MANWDVFHSDRLEVQRALTTDAVRQALAQGELRDDDLIRPAGTTVAWARLADFPALLEPEPEQVRPQDEVEPFAPPSFAEIDGDDDDNEPLDATIDDNEEAEPQPEPEPASAIGLGRDDLQLDDDDSVVALPVVGTSWDEDEEFDPQDEDEAAAEFTLSRGSSEKVEELDLAAMVDVAFQLVLFFLVTATTVLYKSLEVPKPNPDSPAAGAAQGRSRPLDDLKKDYILVEIDPAGTMKVDREPVAAALDALIERLRRARETTGRKAMLLSADFATAHRNAVLAYDAANEIGLNIAIARPSGAPPGGAAPAAAKKANGG